MLTGTPHFTLAEVAANTEWPIPLEYQDNAQATLKALEVLRATLGGLPLRLTSLYRSASGNAATAGSVANSRHLTAHAVDFVPMMDTITGVAQTFAAAQLVGQVAPFDQLLIEPNPDHVHFDPGGVYGFRNQALVGTPATGWVALTEWVQAHPAVSAVTAGVTFPDPARADHARP